MELGITDVERQLLIELLEEEIGSLPAEHHHTQSHDVKELLKQREAVAKQLLERLRQISVEAVTTT